MRLVQACGCWLWACDVWVLKALCCSLLRDLFRQFLGMTARLLEKQGDGEVTHSCLLWAWRFWSHVPHTWVPQQIRSWTRLARVCGSRLWTWQWLSSGDFWLPGLYWCRWRNSPNPLWVTLDETAWHGVQRHLCSLLLILLSSKRFISIYLLRTKWNIIVLNSRMNFNFSIKQYFLKFLMYILC